MHTYLNMLLNIRTCEHSCLVATLFFKVTLHIHVLNHCVLIVKFNSPQII